MSMMFSVNAENVSDLRDNFLGLNNRSDVRDLKITERRFGIESPVDQCGVTWGTVSISPSVGSKGYVSVQRDKFSTPVRFEVQQFTAPT